MVNRQHALTAKNSFVPSLQIAQRIDATDKTEALHAATFRCQARLRELETFYETEAAKIKDAYLVECMGIHGDGEA